MNPISFALRNPITTLTLIVALIIGGFASLFRMPVDIFPNLKVPLIYIVCNYGGMDPSQMEGMIASVYENYCLYIDGVDKIESRNVQATTMVKLSFHEGADINSAFAQTVSLTNRAAARLPPGTLPPFVIRFDAGSLPTGYLVFSSETRSLGELQDMALYRIRPMFSSKIQGVVSPPPFGASARTIVVDLDPERLRSYNLTPDAVVSALMSGNVVSPSGTAYIRDQIPIVSVNTMVRDIQELEKIPLKLGENVYLRDVGSVRDGTDVPVGYALVNGRASVYLPVIKRPEASTLEVVAQLKASLPDMADQVPPDVKISYEFDASPLVRQSISTVATEGFLGAMLTGLMVLVFLRDVRSVIVVVMNIPLALLGSVIGLYLTGNTINLMTLGGLALAIGILVDEATVTVENIHSQMSKCRSLAEAVRIASFETAVPRFLAMLCILSVFIPAFVMQGPVGALFVPLALAVGFSMVTSYLLSSTLVPVISIWLLKHHHAEPAPAKLGRFSFEALQARYGKLIGRTIGGGWATVAIYLLVAGSILVLVGPRLGSEMFPTVDAGVYKIRFRAPSGSNFEITRDMAVRILEMFADEAGQENIDISMGYVGMVPADFTFNMIFQFQRGYDDGMLIIALKKGSGVHAAQFQERLRERFRKEIVPWMADRLVKAGVQPPVAHERSQTMVFGFEPGSILGEVMSFGSPTPIEVQISGHDLTAVRGHALAIQQQLEQVPLLRDLNFYQALNFPTVDVHVDREKAGLAGATIQGVARSMVSATSSSRYVALNYWLDRSSGIDYQVQVEVPPAKMVSAEQVKLVPISPTADDRLLLRDVSAVSNTSMPGEYDRINMVRFVSLTANIAGQDVAAAATAVEEAIARAGEPPRGVKVEMGGQVPPMREMFRGLEIGLAMAIVAILLMLTAYFQSVRLAVVSVSAAPAVLAGVFLALYLTNTTLNIESFMGTIMAIGVSVSNSIMLVTFADRYRLEGQSSHAASLEGATSRLRPILMTSCAMIAGMFPMALGLEEGSEQSAPLGRAVIGGLLASTFATLLILPAIFSVAMRTASSKSPSLDITDRDSSFYLDETTPAPIPAPEPHLPTTTEENPSGQPL